MMNKHNQQKGANIMHPFYFDSPPNDIGIYLPKGSPNTQFNEVIFIDGKIFRNPIGVCHSKTVIEHPIISETILGFIEVVSLPHASQGAGGKDKALPREAMRPARRHRTKTDNNPFCLYQLSTQTH
jgi:hypothetical protein